MDEVFDLLAARTVTPELLDRMMEEDGGEFLSVDIPPTEEDIAKVESAVGALPSDYRRWVARYGAAATPNETGIIFGVSISGYKTLRPSAPGGGLEVASFEEGDDVRFLDAEGVSSSAYDDWYPCFSSFVAAVLCSGNPRVWDAFAAQLRAL